MAVPRFSRRVPVARNHLAPVAVAHKSSRHVPVMAMGMARILRVLDGQTSVRIARTVRVPVVRRVSDPFMVHRSITRAANRYRRWGIGLILPSLFLSSTYYYNNYAALGVGPPPPGYRWVRYGPDLLLVQRGSGRIADVIYGAFY